MNIINVRRFRRVIRRADFLSVCLFDSDTMTITALEAATWSSNKKNPDSVLLYRQLLKLLTLKSRNAKATRGVKCRQSPAASSSASPSSLLSPSAPAAESTQISETTHDPAISRLSTQRSQPNVRPAAMTYFSAIQIFHFL